MRVVQINSTDPTRAAEVAQLNQWFREATAAIEQLQRARSPLPPDLSERMKNLEVAVARLQVTP